MAKLKKKIEMHKINVAIADQHRIMRMGLEWILNKNKHLRVSLLAENPNKLIEEIEFSKDKPDVVVMDYSLLLSNGFELSLKIQKVLPLCKIILLTDKETTYIMHKQSPYYADGFISKSDGVACLQEYIQKIYHKSEVFGN